MPPPVHRDVSPILATFRRFLLARQHKNSLRFADKLSARTQPPPVLPEGPHDKLSLNAYCMRDGRREARPPLLIVDGLASKRAITAGKQSDDSPMKKLDAIVPGIPYQWKTPKNLG